MTELDRSIARRTVMIPSASIAEAIDDESSHPLRITLF